MASKRALNVVVLLGSVRENNMGLRAAKFMVSQLANNGHQVKLLGEMKRAWLLLYLMSYDRFVCTVHTVYIYTHVCELEDGSVSMKITVKIIEQNEAIGKNLSSFKI